MRRRSFLRMAGGTLGAGTLAGCVGQSGGSSGYEFMMSPSEPQSQMMAQYAPLRGYITEELGEQTSLTYASSYSAIIRTLGSGSGHIAEMGPLAAALGTSSDDVEIALQRRGYGSWEYSSVIVAREGSEIDGIEDLEGKELAFADTLSTSGSLHPVHMIKEAGIEVGNAPKSDQGADFEATWSDHGPAFEALMEGQVDAAGVGRFITLNDSREYKEGVKEVAIRDGLPRAPIAVSPELSDEEREAFVSSMVDAPDEVYWGEDGQQDTEDDLWFDAVRRASVEDYASVVSVAEELGIEIDLVDEAAEAEE